MYGKCVVLTRNDTERIDKIVKGIALNDFYYRSYSEMDMMQRRSVISAYEKYTTHLY